jgi:hypothetical protein
VERYKSRICIPCSSRQPSRGPQQVRLSTTPPTQRGPAFSCGVIPGSSACGVTRQPPQELLKANMQRLGSAPHCRCVYWESGVANSMPACAQVLRHVRLQLLADVDHIHAILGLVVSARHHPLAMSFPLSTATVLHVLFVSLFYGRPGKWRHFQQ